MRLKPGEISVDNFAGGGGASTGAGDGLDQPVDIAINHDPVAIDMHKVNHPDTKHYCESVWDVDPVEACEGRPVGLAWFSPDCRHFSKAKGGTPVKQSIRGLAWVAIRWAALVPVRILMLENVEEFKTWGPIIETSPGKFKPCPDRKGETFLGFIQALTTGVPVGSPVWKDIYQSLFMNVFDIKQKLKIYKKIKQGLGHEVDHKTLHACDYGTPTTRKRLFLVARNDGEEVNWPEITHGEQEELLPFKTAADIIDWSKPTRSIFGRNRPLAEKTLNRIAKGLEKYVFNAENPFIVPAEKVVPFITEHANGSSQRNMPANEPLRTICAKVKGGHFAVVKPELRLVTSHMIKFRGDNVGHATDEPVHTISAGGNHIGEVRAFLVGYYGAENTYSCNKPLSTVTTKDRFGIVTIHGNKYEIIDIGMRMLEPSELFAAQGFPVDYIIGHNSEGKKLTKASQVARCGNAVCPPVAQALVEANFPILQQEAA